MSSESSLIPFTKDGEGYTVIIPESLRISRSSRRSSPSGVESQDSYFLSSSSDDDLLTGDNESNVVNSSPNQVRAVSQLTVDSLVVRQQLTVEGNSNQSASRVDIKAPLYVHGTIYSQAIHEEDITLRGPKMLTLKPGDGITIIYANSDKGVVNVLLSQTDEPFERNRRLTVKDISTSNSSENVNIMVPGIGTERRPRIQYYNDNGDMVISTNAGYAINTVGGSVTFRYYVPDDEQEGPIWLIESELLGNDRQ